ncbi:SCO family protein [Sphingobacterium sp. MYb382]
MKRNWGREYPDTIFHTLSDINFLNLKGDSVTLLDVDTAMTVVHLFYSKDQSFSRLMLDNIDGLANRFKENPLVRFYSISVDPQETVASLQAFTKKYKQIDQRHWQVVFHPSVNIFDYAKKDLLIDAMVDPSDSTKFLISNQFVLIDSKGRIRGYYDVSQKVDVDRLEDEIKLQVVEEVRNRPLKIETH